MTIQTEKSHEGILLDTQEEADATLVEAIQMGLPTAEALPEWGELFDEEDRPLHLALVRELSKDEIAGKAKHEGKDVGESSAAQHARLETRVSLIGEFTTKLFIHEDEIEPLIDTLQMAKHLLEISSEDVDQAITRLYEGDAKLPLVA